MPDPVDIYSDTFQVNLGPYGATLNFLLTNPEPPSAGQPPKIERLATARMSLETLKMMAFLIRNQVKTYETQAGIRIPIPREVLNAMRIGPEDWEKFWE